MRRSCTMHPASTRDSLLVSAMESWYIGYSTIEIVHTTPPCVLGSSLRRLSIAQSRHRMMVLMTSKSATNVNPSFLPVRLARLIVALASSTSCASPEPLIVRMLSSTSHTLLFCSSASREASPHETFVKDPTARSRTSPSILQSSTRASISGCVRAISTWSVPSAHTLHIAPAAALFSSIVPTRISLARARRRVLLVLTALMFSGILNATSPTAVAAHRAELVLGCFADFCMSPARLSQMCSSLPTSKRCSWIMVGSTRKTSQ
mmetsp:Transcript_21073/g.48750  ORF Transcript_21073/g.48750 Transcript_21073/m.48750 type:complete len:263 (-) Transcript_21073:553-1341(-)